MYNVLTDRYNFINHFEKFTFLASSKTPKALDYSVFLFFLTSSLQQFLVHVFHTISYELPSGAPSVQKSKEQLWVSWVPLLLAVVLFSPSSPSLMASHLFAHTVSMVPFYSLISVTICSL